MTSKPSGKDRAFSRSNTASARAIAKNEKLELEKTETTIAAQLGLVVPDSNSQAMVRQQTLERGTADAIAVVSAHHNEFLHKLYQPASPIARTLFNEMERARCEACGGIFRAGVLSNLKAVWQIGMQSETPDKGHQLKALFAYLTRQTLNLPVEQSETIEHAASVWHETILNSTRTLWPQLKLNLQDQAKFANICLSIIATINEDTSNSLSANAVPGPPPKPRVDEPADSEDNEDDFSDTKDDVNDPLESPMVRDSDDEKPDTMKVESSEEFFDDDQTSNKDTPIDADSESTDHTLTKSTIGYTTYSTNFDEVIDAKSLCGEEEINQLREQLDNHIQQHARVVGKLSGKLQRMLMAQQNRHWKFDLEEGILDTSKLTRLVTQPHSGLSFKAENNIEFKDTIVTILVDNSKSMLGKPIAIAASCTDLLAQTLERCGVSVEILGFTTTELHGGALFNLWKSEGKSSEPGRLNGLRHIVYKAADAPYRRARTGFGVMLQNELLKQNIDGEALLWATDRLKRRPEERKILLVISDGAPIDSTTMSANRDNYLIEHLHSVIGQIQKQRTVELAAIGIGHDVSVYYKRAITIMDAKDLSKSLLTQLTALFAIPAIDKR